MREWRHLGERWIWICCSENESSKRHAHYWQWCMLVLLLQKEKESTPMRYPRLVRHASRKKRYKVDQEWWEIYKCSSRGWRDRSALSIRSWQGERDLKDLRKIHDYRWVKWSMSLVPGDRYSSRERWREGEMEIVEVESNPEERRYCHATSQFSKWVGLDEVFPARKWLWSLQLI